MLLQWFILPAPDIIFGTQNESGSLCLYSINIIGLYTATVNDEIYMLTC